MIDSNKKLTCYPIKEGFPGTDSVRWYKNGVKIDENEKYQIVETYKLVILFMNLS